MSTINICSHGEIKKVKCLTEKSKCLIWSHGDSDLSLFPGQATAVHTDV